MRKLLLNLILILFCGSLSAQIEYTIIKADVSCNHQSFGDIEVNVNPTHPPYFYLWNNGATTNSIHNLDEGTYSLMIIDNLGTDTTISVHVEYLECTMVPELVFTPNADGINDTWDIVNSESFPQARILIFNRLGQKVFEQNGIYEAWDGKDLFGVPVPESSYYYVIYHKGSDEGTIIKGCVSILR